jgi:hypothetical protein
VLIGTFSIDQFAPKLLTIEKTDTSIEIGLMIKDEGPEDDKSAR